MSALGVDVKFQWAAGTKVLCFKLFMTFKTA